MLENQVMLDISGLTIKGNKLAKSQKETPFYDVESGCNKYIDNASFSLYEGDKVMADGLLDPQKSSLLNSILGALPIEYGELSYSGTLFPGASPNFGVQLRSSLQQNIVLRGLLLGKTGKELRAFVDDITSISELAERLNTPFNDLSRDIKALFVVTTLNDYECDIVVLGQWIDCSSDEIKSRVNFLYQRLVSNSKAALLATSNTGMNLKVCNKVLTPDWEIEDLQESSFSK